MEAIFVNKGDVIFIDVGMSNQEPFGEITYREMGGDPNTKKRHVHEGLEIMQIWYDDGYILIDENIYPMENGAVYFINGNEAHYTNPSVPDKYIRNKIFFRPELFWRVSESLNAMDLINAFYSTSNNRMYSMPIDEAVAIDGMIKDLGLVRNSEKYLRSSSHIKESYITCSILQIMIRIHVFGERTGLDCIHDSQVSHINNIIKYIADNICYFNLDIMCSEIHLSKPYACKIFKQTIGTTVIEYLIHKRISKAKAQLKTTDLSVSQIAMDIGFSNVSLFCRIFKSKTGMTPLKYRKL